MTRMGHAVKTSADLQLLSPVTQFTQGWGSTYQTFLECDLLRISTIFRMSTALARNSHITGLALCIDKALKVITPPETTFQGQLEGRRSDLLRAAGLLIEPRLFKN